jgi:hypothetical protein
METNTFVIPGNLRTLHLARTKMVRSPIRMLMGKTVKRKTVSKKIIKSVSIRGIVLSPPRSKCMTAEQCSTTPITGTTRRRASKS